MSFLMRGLSHCHITLTQMWISASLFGKVRHIFLPPTPTEWPRSNPAAVHLLIVIQSVLLESWSHGWGSLPLHTAFGRNILILPGNVSITSRWLSLVECWFYNRPNSQTYAQFSPDRTKQKIVAHDRSNSPSHNRTALWPNVFLTGIHWSPVILSNGLISSCTIIIKVKLVE
jgi:hypothetical protein